MGIDYCITLYNSILDNAGKEKPPNLLKGWGFWWRIRDSNTGHMDYDSTALTN